VFFCSSDSDFMNGQAIVVDGEYFSLIRQAAEKTSYASLYSIASLNFSVRGSRSCPFGFYGHVSRA